MGTFVYVILLFIPILLLILFYIKRVNLDFVLKYVHINKAVSLTIQLFLHQRLPLESPGLQFLCVYTRQPLLSYPCCLLL